LFILLLVVYCFCISDSRRSRDRPSARSMCSGRWRQFCLASAKHVNTGISNIRIARAARERREVGEVGGIEGGVVAREGNDLQRSELNDHRRQLSDERQLTNIGNHQQHPLHDDSSLIGRLRSMLGTRDLDVDHREKEEKKQDPDRQLKLNDK
jgi:hypothetical protein